MLLRSDVERKAMFGVAENEKLPPQGYAADVGGKVYATLADKARRVLAVGHSAIIDAVFAREHERTTIAELARTNTFDFRGLFLTADLATRVARVGNRVHDASDADAAVAQAQERYALGAMDWIEIDASGTLEQTLARTRAALNAR